jgi:adenylyltransferase/sulfurtransferase
MNENRFNRQIILPEVGKTGQERLKKARVLCVGVGGLGSPVSLYLAAAGVGTLGLIDPDIVDLTNLQRQILFRASDQGSSKVELAKKRLKELDPNIGVETYNEALSVQNAEHLFNKYDLIIDGTDNFSTKFLINDASCKRTIPMVYGAVNQFEGQVALFCGKQGACYRCFHPKPPQAQIRNCAEAGVLGSVVGVVGSLQATLALEYLISQGEPQHPLCPQLGILTLIDLKGSWSIRSIQIPKNPNCPTCSRSPHEIQLTSEPIDVCDTGAQSIHPDKLQTMLLDQSLKTYVLDVREEDEWREGHLKGAHFFPLSRIEKGELPEFPSRANMVVVYCQSGMRSEKAIQILSKANEAHSFYNLKGGLIAWSGPLVKP